MVKIYIAAPLFSKAEKEFNKTVNDFLEAQGYETFLPQKDGHELSELLQNDNSKETAMTKIFERDITAIDNSDVLLFIMDGRVPDEGACLELGYAYAQGKECIGLKTDPRTLLGGHDNPMIVGVLQNRIASDLQEVKAMLAEIKQEQEASGEKRNL